MKKKILNRLSIYFNILCMVCVFALFWQKYYAPSIHINYHLKGTILILFIFALLYFVFSSILDAFSISTIRISESIISQTLSLICANFIMFLITWLLNIKVPLIWPFLVGILIESIISLIWTIIYHYFFVKLNDYKKTIIIYDKLNNIEESIDRYHLNKKFYVFDNVKYTEFDEKILKDIDIVFFADVPSHYRNLILKKCIQYKKDVYLVPRIGDMILSSAKRVHMLYLPIINVSSYNPSLEYLLIKRLFDIIFSIIGIIITSPIMLICGIIIHKTDNGPVFYKQKRYTKDSKVFEIIKLRSMYVDSEKDGAKKSSGDDDERITPIGRFIRKFRIDELPQFFNILTGDMSFVGPRAERIENYEEYEKELPEFRLRTQCKAGLTGYAQIYGKYNTLPYDKLQMDLMYISNPNLFEDIKILFATIKIILFDRESTEGFKEENK